MSGMVLIELERATVVVLVTSGNPTELTGLMIHSYGQKKKSVVICLMNFVGFSRWPTVVLRKRLQGKAKVGC